jgi:hypothetical protein
MDLKKRAVTEIISAIVLVESAVSRMGQEHFFNKVPLETSGTAPLCSMTPELIAQANGWRQDLDNIDAIYGAYLPDEAHEAFAHLWDHLPFGNEWTDFEARYGEGGQCPLYGWAGAFQAAAFDARFGIRRAAGLASS